jgi:hypothetical protein
MLASATVVGGVLGWMTANGPQPGAKGPQIEFEAHPPPLSANPAAANVGTIEGFGSLQLDPILIRGVRILVRPQPACDPRRKVTIGGWTQRVCR